MIKESRLCEDSAVLVKYTKISGDFFLPGFGNWKFPEWDVGAWLDSLAGSHSLA